jgi:hypothetical protein
MSSYSSGDDDDDQELEFASADEGGESDEFEEESNKVVLNQKQIELDDKKTCTVKAEIQHIESKVEEKLDESSDLSDFEGENKPDQIDSDLSDVDDDQKEDEKINNKENEKEIEEKIEEITKEFSHAVVISDEKSVEEDIKIAVEAQHLVEVKEVFKSDASSDDETNVEVLPTKEEIPVVEIIEEAKSKACSNENKEDEVKSETSKVVDLTKDEVLFTKEEIPVKDEEEKSNVVSTGWDDTEFSDIENESSDDEIQKSIVEDIKPIIKKEETIVRDHLPVEHVNFREQQQPQQQEGWSWYKFGSSIYSTATNITSQLGSTYIYSCFCFKIGKIINLVYS